MGGVHIISSGSGVVLGHTRAFRHSAPGPGSVVLVAIALIPATAPHPAAAAPAAAAAQRLFLRRRRLAHERFRIRDRTLDDDAEVIFESFLRRRQLRVQDVERRREKAGGVFALLLERDGQRQVLL